jgi:hypothetical protein
MVFRRFNLFRLSMAFGFSFSSKAFLMSFCNLIDFDADG